MSRHGPPSPTYLDPSGENRESGHEREPDRRHVDQEREEREVERRDRRDTEGYRRDTEGHRRDKEGDRRERRRLRGRGEGRGGSEEDYRDDRVGNKYKSLLCVLLTVLFCKFVKHIEFFVSIQLFYSNQQGGWGGRT